MTITLLILASLVAHGAATANAKPSVLRTSWSRANLVDKLERKIEGLRTSGRSLAATLQLTRHIEPVFGQEKCEACLLYYRSRQRADGTPVERFRDCINLALATCGEERWGDCDALDAFVRQLDGDGTVSQPEAQQGAEALLNHIERDLLPKCANQDMCQPCGVVLDWLDTSGASSMGELEAALSAWQDCVYIARGYCDEPLEVENLECSELDLVDQFLETFQLSNQEVRNAVDSLLQWADTHIRFGCQLREGPLEGVGTRECQGWEGFLAQNFASRQSAALPRVLGGVGWLCTDPGWTEWPPAAGDCFTFFQFYQEMGISPVSVPEPDDLGPAQQRPSACPEAAQLPSSVQITCMEDVSVLHCDPPCSLQDAESNRFLYRVRNVTFDLVPGEIWKTFSVDGLQSMGAAADCRGRVLLWGSDPAFSIRSIPTAPKCEYQLLGSISYLDPSAPGSYGPETIYELPEWRSCLRDDCKSIYERGAWTCALTAVDSPVSSAFLPRQTPELDPASSATLPALSISSNGR